MESSLVKQSDARTAAAFPAARRVDLRGLQIHFSRDQRTGKDSHHSGPDRVARNRVQPHLAAAAEHRANWKA